MKQEKSYFIKLIMVKFGLKSFYIRKTCYYNLDAIIAVGYRVNSKKATMFRIWANRILKEFIIKGYVMEDARLYVYAGLG